MSLQNVIFSLHFIFIWKSWAGQQNGQNLKWEKTLNVLSYRYFNQTSFINIATSYNHGLYWLIGLKT